VTRVHRPGAAFDELLLIDDHLVVACPPTDALACLDGPQKIAGWFPVHRRGTTTTITTATGSLVLERTEERWNDGTLTVDGNSGQLSYHAHLSVRAVIRPAANRTLHQGSELWVHVELAPARAARRAASVIRHAIGCGFEHLRLELDAAAQS
jgi:hypothetical protein